MASVAEPARSRPEHGYVSEEAKRASELERTQKARRKQALDLQKENILSQRTSNPGRRAALEAALAQIESELQELG